MTEPPDALADLADEPVWVAWDSSSGRKVPKSPGGGNARSNDPSTWGTFAEAAAAAERRGWSGVGIMLTGGLVGVDMDGVVGEGGEMEPWARRVVESLGSYAEVSPSGRGVHVIARADPSAVGPVGRADHRRGLEVYNHGRFFTVTGNRVYGGSVADATGAVSRLLAEYFPGESGEERLRRAVGRMARDQVSRRANQAMRASASRDGVRWARVPMGGETCAFCAMLASRGFVYHSAESAGEGDHWHRNCRCKVVPETAGGVEGYDPEEWYGRWKRMEEIDSDPGMSDGEKRAAKLVLTSPGDFGKEAQGGPLAFSLRFLNSSTQLYKNASKVPSLEGYEDVCVHSDGLSFSYTDANDDRHFTLTPRQLADSLREAPGYNGGPIRLIACDSGSNGEESAAQFLANELGVEVLAPTRTVMIDGKGVMHLAETRSEFYKVDAGMIPEKGEWVVFRPKG